MDEVSSYVRLVPAVRLTARPPKSSYVRLVPAVRLTARPPKRLFRLVFESHDGRCYGAAARILHSIVADVNRWSAPMQKLNDLNRSLAALEPDGTLIAVIEMSLSSWLVAGIVPGVERQPLKKLVVDESALLKLLHRWREEAEKAGRRIERIAVAFEAGRDGFWLARWLKARGTEAYVIHASSVAVSREHRRAKTDRLDTELLKRSFLGWLRGERNHCKMVEIP